MKTTNNNKKSKFLALLLSVMMLSSMGAAFAACSDDTDSSSSSSSSSSTSGSATDDRVDNGTIKNSHFDFTTLSETVKIGTSVTGWTRAVNSTNAGSALTSTAASGVISTEEYDWKKLTERKADDDTIKGLIKDPGSNATDAQKESAAKESIRNYLAVRDTYNTADQLYFYDAWEDVFTKLDIDDMFEEVKEDSYVSFNIDADDLPEEGMTNPGRAPKQAETYDNGDKREHEDDHQVLMIHNKHNNGTAQKYTSSSTVTVAANTAAEISVWVKTVNLKSVSSSSGSSAGAEQDAVGKGAYINVTQTVGGKTLDTFEVKNIQTPKAEEDTENNGWEKYTFYLKGSSFTDSKFTLVLGLGQGGGTDRLGYVNGYAFFDNIQYKELTADEYETATANVDEIYLSSEKVDKVVDTSDKSYSGDNNFAMNFYDTATLEGTGWQDASGNQNASSSAEITDNTDGAKTNEELKNDADVMKHFATREEIGAVAGNDYLSTVYDKFLKDTDKDNDFLNNNSQKEILMMLSSMGAAYTWEDAYTFSMPKDVNYMAISFFVKTSDFGEGTGLSVTLTNDRNDKSTTAFSALNTANLEGVTIGGVDDYYDGWQRCYFFIEKSEDIQAAEQEENNGTTFSLKLNYGVTSVSISTPKTSFVPGFAALTNFETLNMNKFEYDCSQASTYALKYTLEVSEEEKAAGNAGFDAAASTPSNALNDGLANPQNYKGVYEDSFYVTLPEGSVDTDDERRLINAYANAGLLNRVNFTDPENDIVNKNDGVAWMEGLKAISGKTDATDIWNAVFGKDSTQPLFIYNDGVGDKSYGYIGGTTTMSSAYTAISVRVKTSADALASVYLIDMDDPMRSSALKVSNSLTYWYDDNGNVLNKEDGDVVLRLDKKTGLYKVEKKWNTADYEKGDYYANLAAYAGFADKADVLYANEDSATHAYHASDWDRAVYYKHTDGKYYTEAGGKGTLVHDFQERTDIETRLDGGEERFLCVENINTNDEWATVTFYVKKGNVAKNYRLEVWSSGTRAGDMNPAGSYVAFDTNNPGTASDLYSKLLEEYEDSATDSIEGIFSYFDTDKHVRYDKTLEEEYVKNNDDVDDLVGNLYQGNFKASNYEETIAYLRHETTNGGTVVAYNVFADYSLTDITVYASTPDTDNDEDEDTDTDTDTTGDEMNVFMLIGSIAVSAALFVALGGLATQIILKQLRKRKAAKARVNVVKKSKK